jgi:hypothetical protein
MLEIVGFVLLLNASRIPIPPQPTDIRSNIAYLEKDILFLLQQF